MTFCINPIKFIHQKIDSKTIIDKNLYSMDTKSNETPRIVQPRLLQREQKLWKAATFENDVLDKHGIIQEKQGHVQKLVMSSK